MSEDWGSDNWTPKDPTTPDNPALAPAPAPQSTEPEPPRLHYGSTDEFVREYLRHVYRRAINGRSRVWAAAWWQHDEAVIRLEALWRSWEHLRLDPATGMSIWWRDHADHHMPILIDPDGPFAGADANSDTNRSTKGAPLPYLPPPEGLFPDVRTTPIHPLSHTPDSAPHDAY